MKNLIWKTLILIMVLGISYKPAKSFAGGGGSSCGNGVIESGEECDDGNQDNTDGCNTSCMIVPTKLVKFSCYGPAHSYCSQAKTDCEQNNGINCLDAYKDCLHKAEDFCDTCGDGKIDQGETCDDGPNNGPDKQCTDACAFQPTQDVDQGCFSPKTAPCAQQKQECQKSNGENCPEMYHLCLVSAANSCPLHIDSPLHSNSNETAPVCNSKKGCHTTMGCSFLPGTENSGGIAPWCIFALGLLPLLQRRLKKHLSPLV